MKSGSVATEHESNNRDEVVEAVMKKAQIESVHEQRHAIRFGLKMLQNRVYMSNSIVEQVCAKRKQEGRGRVKTLSPTSP